MTEESDQVIDVKVKEIPETEEKLDEVFIEELSKQFGTGHVPKRVLTTRGFTFTEIVKASK